MRAERRAVATIAALFHLYKRARAQLDAARELELPVVDRGERVGLEDSSA